MLAGELYLAADRELVAERARAAELLRIFNRDHDQTVLRALFGSIGRDSEIRAPFWCDYGYNISVGAGVFLNFNCVLLDVVPITIGDRVQVGPGVQMLAADHPRGAEERASGRENGRPITVEDDVWLGGGVILCPGVTVGRDSVVGAGSVVTRDVPPAVVAAGNPCRVLRAL
jgi:maltose O-acetyltransferase